MSDRRVILLAEDDEDDRVIFRDAIHRLNDKSIHLEVAEDGIDVLKMISENDIHPDLFVLDQNMPRMRGKETLAWLKKQEKFRSIPVIIYSTHPDNALVKEFETLGAAMVMPKPDSYDGFKEMVTMFVKDFLK